MTLSHEKNPIKRLINCYRWFYFQWSDQLFNNLFHSAKDSSFASVIHSISFSPLWQVKNETPRTPRTTSASCTSSRPSPATRVGSGRLSTRTSPAPQTLTTSAGSSATSRTQCCSSLSGTMGSSELPFSGEKQEENSRSCHCLDIVWAKDLMKPKLLFIVV